MSLKNIKTDPDQVSLRKKHEFLVLGTDNQINTALGYYMGKLLDQNGGGLKSPFWEKKDLLSLRCAY